MTNIKCEEKLREEFIEFFKSMSLDFHYKGDIDQAARWWLGKMAEQRKEMIAFLEQIEKEKWEDAEHCS